MHACGDVHHLLAAGPVNLHEHRGVILVPENQIDVLVLIAHPGDIAQAHERAVAVAEKDDLLEVLLVVALAEGPDPYLGFPGIDAAGGQIQRTAADRVGDIGEGESEGSQSLERYLDRDLVLPYAADVDLGHRGKRGEFILDLVRQFLQRTFGYVAMDDEPHHALAVRHLPEPGTLGPGRKRLNAVDCGLDVVQRARHVRTGVHFDPDGCHAGGRHGLDRFHIIEPADLVLDLDDDRFLHLLRGGAGIDHRDFDVIEGDGGPRLPLDTGERHQSGGENPEHQEVGGNAVARHVGDRAGTFAVELPVAAHAGLIARAGPRSGRACLRSRTGFRR